MKVVILDRDGVINVESPDYIKSPDEWIPIPDSIQAIAELTGKGYTVCVATNQSGLARGYFDIATLDKMHQKMRDIVEKAGGVIAHIAFCPHGPEAGCLCRKPKPGLLHQLAKEGGFELTPNVPFVGDSLRDIEAAHAAGILPVLLCKPDKKPNMPFAYESFPTL
ncbi:MAG: D-glycero-beta-D-manno-heptose 1,7-bisphosphate 7-phosphatase, partial [Pseudomonadota bacterium]